MLALHLDFYASDPGHVQWDKARSPHVKLPSADWAWGLQVIMEVKFSRDDTAYYLAVVGANAA